jgi:predicted transcriptional regulator
MCNVSVSIKWKVLRFLYSSVNRFHCTDISNLPFCTIYTVLHFSGGRKANRLSTIICQLKTLLAMKDTDNVTTHISSHFMF